MVYSINKFYVCYFRPPSTISAQLHGPKFLHVNLAKSCSDFKDLLGAGIFLPPCHEGDGNENVKGATRFIRQNNNFTRAAHYFVYYTLYSLSIFSLDNILQLILEISATYGLDSYPLADNWLICRLRAQCMIFKSNVKSVPYDGAEFVLIYFKTMYSKTIIRFGFCDTLHQWCSFLL